MYLSFFNDPAPTAIYTLSLHDALPIFLEVAEFRPPAIERGVEQASRLLAARDEADDLEVIRHAGVGARVRRAHVPADRKSTRLNSSHMSISYAVFCLKKKKKKKTGSNI